MPTLSRLRIIKNVIRDGLAGVWRHKGMGFASVFSVTAMLFMFGVALILLLNVNVFLNDTQVKVGDIDVFILNETSNADQDAIRSFVEQDPRIANRTYYTREEAYEVFKASWKDEAYLLEGMQEAFQPYYVLQLHDNADAHGFVAEMSGMAGVEKINYYQDLIDRIETISFIVRTAGLVVVAALILISFFVISNTIKLTVVARRKEIEVMRYVGASTGMIEGPFLIEGMAFGLIGSAIAFLIVYLGYRELFERYGEWFYQMSSSNMIHPLVLRTEFVILFATLGGGVGLLGSLFSLRKYRRI